MMVVLLILVEIFYSLMIAIHPLLLRITLDNSIFIVK